MKMSKKHSSKIVAGLASAVLMFPQLAVAGGISGFIGWGTNIMTIGMQFVGALMALAGVVAIMAGAWNFIQHFKQGQHDSADGKSKISLGAVQIVVGFVLGTGAWQTIANSENFSASIPQAQEVFVASINHISLEDVTTV